VLQKFMRYLIPKDGHVRNKKDVCEIKNLEMPVSIRKYFGGMQNTCD